METKQAFKLSMGNMEWLTENYERLKKEFNGKWVAVSDAHIVEAAEDLPTLTKAIAKHEKRESIVVEYIRAEPIAMFF
jgi:hypothetical protein